MAADLCSKSTGAATSGKGLWLPGRSPLRHACDCWQLAAAYFDNACYFSTTIICTTAAKRLVSKISYQHNTDYCRQTICLLLRTSYFLVPKLLLLVDALADASRCTRPLSKPPQSLAAAIPAMNRQLIESPDTSSSNWRLFKAFLEAKPGYRRHVLAAGCQSPGSVVWTAKCQEAAALTFASEGSKKLRHPKPSASAQAT